MSVVDNRGNGRLGPVLGTALILLVSFGGIFDDTGGDATPPVSTTQPSVTIDLVKGIRHDRDQFDSFWVQSNRSPTVQQKPNRPEQPLYFLHTHYAPPDEYDLLATITLSERRGAVALNVPASSNIYQFHLANDKFEFLGGDGLPSGTLPNGMLPKGIHRILVKVRHDSVSGYFDDALLASFDPTKLPSNTPETLWSRLDQRELAVFGNTTLHIVYGLQVTEVTGHGTQLPPGPVTGDAGSKENADAKPGDGAFDQIGESTTQPGSTTQPAVTIDLIPKVRASRDQFSSIWAKKGDMVIPQQGRPDQDIYVVHTHYQPPEEYDCMAWVKPSSRGGAVAINLPAARNVYQFRLFEDKFEFVGGDGLPTGPSPAGPYKGDSHIVVKVRHDSVAAYLNDVPVASFDPTNLPSNTPKTLWSQLDQPEIAVMGDATLLRVYQLQIAEVTGRGKQLRLGPVTGNTATPAKTTPDANPGPGAPNESNVPNDVDSSTAPKVNEIRGLVVMRTGDTQFHGQAIDIISTTYATHGKTVKISPIGSLGNEMRISLSEASRLLNIRHPDLPGLTIQISFGDKYSPIDGGSAGAAFTLLLLSSAGDFEIDPDAAMTGDITVDGKIRAVGEVPAKVHGAALDKCRLVSIPGSNVADIDDGIVTRGAAALWETQIFSANTLDDAIANMRKDHAPPMSQAMDLFDELKSQYEDKPVKALAATDALDKLNRIVSLAPNHVSAIDLLRLAGGKGPTHLSAVASVSEALKAAGPSIASFATGTFDASLATEDSTEQALGALRKVRDEADPAAAPFVRALSAYVSTYRELAIVNQEGNPDAIKRAIAALQQKADGVRAAIIKVGSNSELIDKMMHKQ